ncbi:MAG: tRNA-dihydrouridine synthase family protein [Spirochaetales bacterium]|nr:tRNA-dihydrouridine synthase family protein [Spirochaetales bacterium]
MPLYLAPLEGLTNYLFRKTFCSHFTGVDKAFTPFLTTNKNRKFKNRDLKELEKLEGMNIIPQIMSNNADDFAAMSNQLFDLGFDEINWNTGCPYPTVVAKKKGAGLLPYPDMIDRILDQVMARSPCTFSVKTRLGLNTVDDFIELIPVFNRYPLTELIIHPRTAVQKYSGTCDRNFVKFVISEIACPVCYSGDINSLEEYHQLIAGIPSLHSVMIGRAAVSRPFIFEEIKSNTPFSRAQGEKQILVFQEELRKQYEQVLSGDAHLLHKMKDCWKYFGQYFGDDKKLFKILKAKTRTAFIEAVADYY